MCVCSIRYALKIFEILIEYEWNTSILGLTGLKNNPKRLTDISPAPSYIASARMLNQQPSHPRLLKELTIMLWPTSTYFKYPQDSFSTFMTFVRCEAMVSSMDGIWNRFNQKIWNDGHVSRETNGGTQFLYLEDSVTMYPIITATSRQSLPHTWNKKSCVCVCVRDETEASSPLDGGTWNGKWFVSRES